MSFLTIKTEDCNKLLLIFIHGFKGCDKTFLDFPNRLQDILKNSKHEVITESIVYPQYETRGELKTAVELFCSWLEKIVNEREEEIKSLGGKGLVWVCLCGHSMGGIVAADAILKYNSQSTTKPNIIGLFAFDTPYYGLASDVFQRAAMERANEVTGTLSYLSSTAAFVSSFVTKPASSTESSGSRGYGKWLGYGLAGAASAAIAGTAIYHRDKVSNWVKDHIRYVGILWDHKELAKRVNDLIEVPDICFHCYYTLIPPKDVISSARTFISLPPPEMVSYFTPIKCTASDEIDAHTNMFDPDRDQYFTLGSVFHPRLIEMVEKWEKTNVETSA